MAGEAGAEVPRLKGYGIKNGKHSISGLSSGAFMAVQLHIAHSASFIGAGIIAGGPYRCVETVRIRGIAGEDSYIMNAEYICMTPLTPRSAPDGKSLAALARKTGLTGHIDDLDNLRDQSVYIFTGTEDKVVAQDVVRSTRDFYQELEVKAIEFIDNVPAGHAIITNNPEDSPLYANRPPYINQGCFMQSHQILEYIYRKIKLQPASATLPGTLIRFPQAEFAGSDFASSSLDKYGYVYIPKAVQEGSAKAIGVHIVLHGCKQGYGYVSFTSGLSDRANQPPYGNRYITTTGYNHIAESNNIIVLYPQIVGDDGANVQNPDGCWDWWGYTSKTNVDTPDYYSKNAVQIKALHNMLQRLCS